MRPIIVAQAVYGVLSGIVCRLLQINADICVRPFHGGDGHQHSCRIEVVLNVRFNVIFGKVTYDNSSPLASTKLKCGGGVIKDRYISLYYENEKSSMLQHGTIILLLSGNNERLTGSFLGIGPLNEKIVSGTVALAKH